jgi:predicted  nucleic acid-binding Zn-ribbon protein
MSDSDTKTLPKNLEDALQEIDSLKSQLSGSDLIVFSQNRELRLENQKLKDEIRQLTEQCVTQSFSVRGLEKNEVKLKAKIEGLETQVSELKAQVTGLETQVADLGGQLEEFRSKEVHLSQELEKTVAASAQALEQLKSEHEQLVDATNAELEKARLSFEEEVSNKEKAIQALEVRVEQFKEEFLSQELAPLAAVDTSSGGGRAYEILRSKMEGFLGYPGQALVEQVFRLSGVEHGTTNPSELEETFEVLQDTASQLVRLPGQEEELAALLASAWKEIGLGEEPAASSNEVSKDPAEEVESPQPVEEAEQSSPSIEEAAPEADQSESLAVTEGTTDPTTGEQDTAADESTPEVEASVPQVEAMVEPVADPDSGPTEEAVEVAAEEAVEVAAEEAVEVASEEAVEVAAEATVVEEAAEAEEAQGQEPEVEPAAEESQEVAKVEAVPATEDATEVAPEETEQTVETEVPGEGSEATADQEMATVEPPGVAPHAEEAEREDTEETPQAPSEEGPEETPSEADSSVESQPAEAVDFERAAAFLGEGRHAEALPMFEALHSQDVTESTYQVGRLACLAGMGRFAEAYAVAQNLEPNELGESLGVYNDSVDAALVGLAKGAESDLVRKEYILELLLRSPSEQQTQVYLDEADEIALRIDREGELSLLQATHRIGHDDVTEYLIDALHSLSDRPDVFALLRTNLERYPELRPLSEFLESLLDSSRAESLEAESEVKELLGQGESVEDLLDEADPGEEAVVQVFLEHLIPRAEVDFDIPSEDFEELLLEAEPAAFVGSLRQALRSVDYTVFFDEIEVLSYDGDDHFLLRSSPEPTPTLLFGADLDDVPPEELRFLVLRELFSMYRRHSQLAHISAGLDDFRRVKLVRACIDIFSEFESKVPPETMAKLATLAESAKEGDQSQDFKVQIVAFLREVYIQTESDSFLELGDFLYGGQLNRKWLDSIADGFAAKQTGIVVASYAICRDAMEEEDFEKLEEEGFGWLYSETNRGRFGELRLRLQRLWTTPLKALISEPEE